jgi:hypothetical protein
VIRLVIFAFDLEVARSGNAIGEEPTDRGRHGSITGTWITWCLGCAT